MRLLSVKNLTLSVVSFSPFFPGQGFTYHSSFWIRAFLHSWHLPTTFWFYSPNTRQLLEVGVGWKGVWFFFFFFFLSSVDMKVFQCWGNGMNWDVILAPSLPSSWPRANHLAFPSLNCFICSERMINTYHKCCFQPWAGKCLIVGSLEENPDLQHLPIITV